MDHDAFLAAIIARPDDDLPRLIYADWLDEHGHAERAEFIRVQCELAAPGKPERCGSVCYPEHCDYCRWKIRQESLRLRERELATVERLWDWCPQAVKNAISGPSNPRFCDLWDYRRGFVEAAVFSWANWRQHADAIRRATPLRKVRLTTFPDSPNTLYEPFGAQWPSIEFELPGLTAGTSAVNIGRFPLAPR